jgi:hypothetical protein
MSVLQAYADVQHEVIPADCDAVVVGLDGTSTPRPLVIVQRGRPRRRERFSMAHELGHILIPWHLGTEVCFNEWAYYETSPPEERQAHAFASEVLVPTRWLSAMVASTDSVGGVLQELNRANVSASAGCLAVVRALPPGCVLALMHGRIAEMVLQSPGSVAHLPAEGEVLDEKLVSRFCVESGDASVGGRRVKWWVLEVESSLREDDDDRGASELLRAIVDDIYGDDSVTRQHTLASINSIAGLAKDRWAENDPSAAQLLAIMRARFIDRRQHARVMEDPRFDAYLEKKARELAAKKRAK